MSNQTKIGLLLGLGVVLLVGIIVSDHLATQAQSDITDSAPILSELNGMNGTNQPDKNRNVFLTPGSATNEEIAQANPAVNRGLSPVIALNDAPTNHAFMAPAPAVPPQVKIEVAPSVKEAVPTPPAPAPHTYIVKFGDTLSIIAASTLGSRNRWQEILDANKQTLTSSQKLSIGMVLKIPAPTAATVPPAAAAQTAPPIVARTYTVQKGDLLGSIASKQLGSVKRVKDLLAVNKKTLPSGEKSMLHVGLVLNMPAQ
jgi:nucleoid-associated protein YgaU